MDYKKLKKDLEEEDDDLIPIKKPVKPTVSPVIKPNNPINMLNILNKLKTMLPADDFIITGSYALAQYGLCDPLKISDLDIILVNPTPDSMTTMAALVKGAPTAKSHLLPPDSDLKAIFIMDEKVINIFIHNKFTEPYVTINGLNHATVPHIIEAKKKYGRIKDWIQCRNMSRLFFIPEEFEKVLTEKQDQLLRGNY